MQPWSAHKENNRNKNSHSDWKQFLQLIFSHLLSPPTCLAITSKPDIMINTGFKTPNPCDTNGILGLLLALTLRMINQHVIYWY